MRSYRINVFKHTVVVDFYAYGVFFFYFGLLRRECCSLIAYNISGGCLFGGAAKVCMVPAPS